MDREYNYHGLYPVVGLIDVLGAVRGADALLAFLSKHNAETFSLPLVILWSRALTTLLLATVLLFQLLFIRPSRTFGRSWSSC